MGIKIKATYPMPKTENVKPETNKEGNIQESESISQESTKKPIKLSKLDQGILTVMHANPESSRAEIVNQVVDLGLAKHKPTVYNRLRKRDYLQAELQQIENFHAQQLQREDYPLARKRLNKALKDKEITHKEALPYVKLVYDKVHGEKHFNQAPQVIHIDSINNAQLIIGDDIRDDAA